MPLIQIKTKAQVTIPVKFRKALGLEKGDYLEAELKDGKITLTPVKTIDKSEAWFFTKEWQEGERRVDEDLKNGRYVDYDNPKDFIDSLKKSI
jgi:antitoxin MazE